MAYNQEITSGFGTYDLKFVYNLDASVGWGGANRRDDVMLVQVLLNILVGGESIAFRQSTLTGNLPVLKVDGVFGPKTSCLLTVFLNLITSDSVSKINPARKPAIDDPLCKLQLLAYISCNKKYYERSVLHTAPAVLEHALKTTRKA